MTPYLTARGKAALATGVIWLLLGAILLVSGRPEGAWPLLFASSGVLITLLATFMATIPAGWLIDRRFLELELSSPDESEVRMLQTGVVVSPMLRLTNRAGLPLRRMRLAPELSTALTMESSALPVLDLPAASSIELPIPVCAQVSGRWFIHGFHVRCRGLLDLFEISDYLPSSRPMKFLPRGLLTSRRGSLRPTGAALHDRVGVHELDQRGCGTDLREIREHQHGDPFRNIAWKATARTGKLMVREFEREVTLNTYLVVDMSSTMRGRSALGSKLEHAVQLASNFSRALLRGNDRCGLITFDAKIYGHLPPREGGAQMTRLTQHLVGLTNVVDADLTEHDEDTVTDRLIHYLLLQERLDFRHRARSKNDDPSQALGLEELYDVDLLRRWLKRRMPQTEERFADSAMEVGVVGRGNDSLVRRYCQLRGVEIPYRSEVRYGHKEQGLVESIERILTESRNPFLILIFSDLSGLVDTERLVKALRLARARRHRVVILAPYSPNYVPRPGPPEASEREALLYDLFERAAKRERRSVLRALERATTPVIEVGPQTQITTLLRRVKLFR